MEESWITSNYTIAINDHKKRDGKNRQVPSRKKYWIQAIWKLRNHFNGKKNQQRTELQEGSEGIVKKCVQNHQANIIDMVALYPRYIGILKKMASGLKEPSQAKPSLWCKLCIQFDNNMMAVVGK